MVEELGTCDSVLSISGRDPEDHLHHERGGELELQLTESHKEPRVLPDRGGGLQAAVSGTAKCGQEVVHGAVLEGSDAAVRDDLPRPAGGSQGGLNDAPNPSLRLRAPLRSAPRLRLGFGLVSSCTEKLPTELVYTKSLTPPIVKSPCFRTYLRSQGWPTRRTCP